jgi:hypothetical protein
VVHAIAERGAKDSLRGGAVKGCEMSNRSFPPGITQYSWIEEIAP